MLLFVMEFGVGFMEFQLCGMSTKNAPIFYNPLNLVQDHKELFFLTHRKRYGGFVLHHDCATF